MKQNKFLLKALILGFMAICIFASCKVGLGASIDTQKPLVSFVTPEPDATKKGTFTISGTASDDSDIRSVNINLVLNGESKYSYNAIVNKTEGTWTLTIPTIGENGDILVDDGNYEFQVIATDIDGKTSSDKRAIRIDNSAPTVLVNSPSLFDENKSTFFRQLRVSGSCYDASGISNVKLYFYQEGEESLDYADTEKYAVFQAEGTNTWELSKDLTEADTFFKDNTVYNFFVVAEDIAGNKNTYFYRMGDFYNENVLKDTNPNDGDDYIPFPSMMQIGMLDQGKEVTNTTSGLTLEGLEKIQIPCSNDENNNSNILYRSESATSISWGNIEYDEDEEHNKYPRAIPLETDISGQLKSTDGTDILPNSVEIWIKKETTKKDINEDWWQVESENITLDSSGKTIAFNIVLKKDGEYLKSGNYLIMIKYQTVASSNLPILVSDAHQFAISAGMPVLTETSLSKLGGANTSVSNPINLQVSTNIDKVTISGKALKGDRTPVNSIDVILNGVSVESPSINQVDGTWSIELTDEGVYQYEFTVTDGNNTNTIHRTVIIDRTKPEITNVDFSQNQEKTEITLKAFIIETNAFNSIEYAFIEKENAEVDDLVDSDWHSAGTLSSMNIKLNSLAFAGTSEFAQGPWTLFVKAIDNASNEAIEKYTGVLDLDSPKFENFKSTSIPASGYLNTDFEYVIEDKEILASDNYKIKKIEIVAKKDGIVQSNFGYTKNLSKASITKADLNDLPVIEGKVGNAGKWIITTTLYDLNDNKVEKTVDFTLDVTCPEIVISSYPQPENDNGATFDFKGTAEDEQSSISEISVSLDKTKWEKIDGSKTWICELPIPTEGEGVVYAKAKDGAGNESAIVEQAFVFDKSHPSVTVTTNSGDPEWATGTNYTLEGTAEDSWLMSEVTITQTRGTETVTLTEVNYDATAKTWKVEGLPRNADNSTIASADIETGTYVYTIVAKDKAGKTSEKKVTVQIDKDAPTVPEVISPNGNVGENAIAVKTYRFQGNTADIGSSATGVKQVEYKISESSTPETSGTTILASSGSWNFTQDFEEGKEGKKYLHIRSEDNAGNKSDWKTVPFDVDFSAPEVKVSENFKGNEKAIFTLSGTAKDTKGLASANSVVITQRKSAGEPLAVGTTVTGNSWTTQSLPVVGDGISVEAGNEADYNGTYTYEIKATDWCGKTTTITKTVNFDTVAPKIEVQNLTSGTYLNEDKLEVRGSVNDESKISGFYWVLDSNPSVPSNVLGNWTGWTKIDTQNNWIINLSGMKDGNHTLKLAAVDAQGNVSETTEITFSTDITPPTLDDVIDTEPVGTYLKKGISFSFANKAGATVAKDNYELSRYEIIATKDGKTQTGENSPINYWYKKELSGTEVTQTELNDIPVLESKEANNGAWKFTIAVYDKAGNKAEATRSFTVDATNPELTSIDVYPKAEEDRTSPFTFKGKASDRGLSSLSEVKVSLDNKTWITAIGTKEWNCELAIPTEGVGKVYAKAIDGAGNESAIVEQIFTFDKSRPSVAVTTNSGNPEWATGTNYTLEGTAEDSWLMSEDSPVAITQTRGTETVTLTGVKYDVVAKTWTVEGLPRKADNSTIASADIETGTYVYTIVAKDKAGKPSEKTVTVQIDKDAPTVPEVISPNGNVGINAISVKTYRFQGNTADTGSSATGVKQVEYKISESSSPETSGTTILASSGSWNFTQDFEEGKEGKKYLHIRSEDNAGNESSWKTVEFDVDFSAPEVKVSENFKGNEKAIFTLSGTAKDTKGLASANSVVITQRDSAGKALTVTPTVTGNNWESQSLPVVDNGKSVEVGKEAEYNGTYTYEIKATDWCGKTTTITKTVNFDTIAPELDIKNLKDGEFLAQKEIIIQGTVRDSSKIDAVYYQTTKENAEPDSTKWTPIKTQNSWQIPLKELNQGNQVLHLKVVDELGNGDNKVTSVSFTVDTEKPSISVDKDAGKTYYTKDGITVSGTAEDAISLKQVDIKLGATTLATIKASEIGEDKKWSYEIKADDLASDIATNVIISAVDNAGHVETAPVFNVYKDTKVPTLVLNNIADKTIITEQDLSNNQFTVKGSWNDNGGSGYAKLEYCLDAEISDSTKWTEVKVNNAVPGSTWTFPITLETETLNQTLNIRVTDTVGNSSVTSLNNIIVDKSVPNAGTTSLDNQYIGKNGSYKLEGLAKDSLGLAKIEIKSFKNGVEQQPADTITLSGDKSKEWAKVLEPTSDVETWSYSIIAHDKAGRTSVAETRTVFVDKKAPEFGETKITTEKAYGQWYKDNVLSITGTLTEDTGIKELQFSTDNSTWTNFYREQNDKSYTFSGTISINEEWKNKTIYIKAVDTLDNGKEETEKIKITGINVDRNNPTVTINESIVYVNASTESLSISVKPSDSGSGVKAVRAKINDGSYGSEIATGTNGTYTIPLNVEDLKKENIPSTGTITVEVIDNVGKTGYATVQYEKDVDLPKVEITSHSNDDNDDIVNKTITLKGSTTESQGLAKVEIFVNGSDTASETFEGNAGFNWSCEIDTTKIYNGTETKDLPIKVVATDNAGNESKPQEITLKIDQKSDRPEITLNNVSSGEAQYLTDTMILGVISDDDGPITALKIAVKPESGEIDWNNIPKTTVTKAGSFGFILSGDDGKTELCFQVEANGATFETEKSLLEQPKIMDVDEKEVENGLVVFNLDTNTPDINTEKTKLIFGDNPEGEIFANNIQVGGKRKEFDLEVQATDGNGIKEVTLEIEGISDPYKLTPDGENWKKTVDTTAIEDGLKTFKITVVDNAGASATLSKQILVDNQAPSIDIESHTIGETVLGKTRISGTTTDDIDGISGSGIKSVKWLVAKDTVLETKTSDDDIIDLFINPTEEEKNNIKTYSVKGTLSWNYSFGDNNDNLGVLVKDDGYGHTIGNEEDEIYELPIFFLIEDNVGNQKLERFRVNVDPNGDKPRPFVSYPSDGEKLGGTIRINGTTEIAEGTVGKVYIQLGSLDEKGTFKPFTKDAFDTWFKEKDCPYTFDTIENETVIEATGTAAWNITINENKEFNLGSGFTGLVEKDGLSYVLFRVRAKNTEDKLGAWTELITISLDKKVPEISNPRLVKYNGDKEIASKDYISGDWISGNDWNLVTTVKDENGLISIKLTEVSENAKIEFDEIKNVRENEEIEVKIPLETTSFEGNNFSFILSATDKSQEQNNSEKLISLKFDNNGPELEPLKHGGKEIDKEANPIEQDNNGFDISSSITEKNNGSDLDRILLYFEDTHKDKYYVPMEDDKKSVLSSWTGKTLSDGLPGKKIELDKTGRPDERTIQDDSIGTNKFIKKGGVVRIGNILCRIESVDDSTGKVTIDTDVPTNFTDAEFIYALVIDNINGGEYIDQKTDSLENDDGDGFEEKLSLTGSTYDWSVVINSKNIPDGPVTMYYMAYDKAGNCSEIKAQETMVQNNRPAIAKVWLGTDLNGNGDISSNEEVLYREDETRETADGSVTFNAANFTAKGLTSIRPEIVGGNGDLYYEDISDDYANTTLTLLREGEDDEIAENDEAIKLKLVEVDDNTTLAGRRDTALNETEKFTFKIWDSTPGLEPGVNSLSATITVSMKIDVEDDVAPTVVIKPLFWNSKDDNSLYKNGTETDGSVTGHIELSKDLPEDFKDSSDSPDSPESPESSESSESSETSDFMDRDDKVSGKITFKGTAYDDVRLEGLNIKFDEFDFGDNNGDTFGVINFSNGQLNNAASGKTINGNGWEFSFEEKYLDQRGHKVNWTFSIDTAKITGVASADVNLTVSATDSRNSSSTEEVESEDETEKNVPSYKVDVVPYITGLETTLTKLEKKNPSVYGRSALGKYPVYYYRNTIEGSPKSETIVLQGFNIKSGSTVTFNDDKDVTTTLGEDMSFTLPENAKSGKIKVTVNSIDSLNNINDNEAKVDNTASDNESKYANAYNRQPNGQNNDLLTDDVEIAIWEINSKAAIAETGELSEVVMHVNPKNGMLGFAFAHSQDLASYPNGNTSSYQTWITDWTGVNQIGFVYDKNGNMFGTNGGTDTYTPNKKTGRLGLISSHWGIISENSASNDWYSGYTKLHRLRLEYLGLTKSGGAYASNVYRFAKGSSIQLATTTDSSNGTNLYMLYYDNTMGELKFKAGNFGSAPKDPCGAVEKEWGVTQSTFSQATATFGDFADDAYNERDNDEGTNYLANYATISIVANQSGAKGDSSVRPGIYYSVSAVDSTVANANGKDVVVAVWYDDVNKTLWYSYLVDPLANAGDRDYKNKGTETADSSIGVISTEWAEPVAILDGHAGGYCAIKADDKGGIHIAAYSRNDAGSLYYAYLNQYNSKFNESTNLVAVDSYGSQGQYITMEVAKNGNNYIPYIGYYMNSMSYPKYAYLANPGEGVKAGVDEDNMYTGNWETIMLPTTSSIVLDDINIGVYKKDDGTLQAIPSKPANKSETIAENKKSGIAVGNDTVNPIFAYGIAQTGSGYIETAQLK